MQIIKYFKNCIINDFFKTESFGLDANVFTDFV